MTDLADAVLPQIRTRADLHRWSASNAHGRQMHDAVDTLERAAPTEDPVKVYAVTHRALASAIKVIARADDSSGIIGDACRRLLDLHPKAAAAGAQHYRIAARRLARMRKLAAGSDNAAEVDDLIAELRETHRRRPRLQQEFDGAGLP